MNARPILYAFAIVAGLLFVMMANDRGTFAEQEIGVKRDGEFDGKIVAIYFGNPENGSGQILTDVSLTEIGGRMMLVGTGADTGDDDNWTAGVRMGVAWDSVATYYAMTKDQYDEKLRNHAD